MNHWLRSPKINQLRCRERPGLPCGVRGVRATGDPHLGQEVREEASAGRPPWRRPQPPQQTARDPKLTLRNLKEVRNFPRQAAGLGTTIHMIGDHPWMASGARRQVRMVLPQLPPDTAPAACLQATAKCPRQKPARSTSKLLTRSEAGLLSITIGLATTVRICHQRSGTGGCCTAAPHDKARTIPRRHQHCSMLLPQLCNASAPPLVPTPS